MPYEPNPTIMNKARRTLSELQEAVYEPMAALAVTAWVTKEPVPYSERESGRRITLRPGDKWGDLWDCAWFRFEGVVPNSLKGRKVVLLIDVNGELCLVDGEGTPLQGLTNVNSEFDLSLGLPGKRVVDVSPSAQGGEIIDLWGDAGCNDLFGRYRSGTLKEAEIAVCREDVRRLYHDFEVLIELADQLPDGSARKARVCQCLYEASNALASIDAESVRRASEIVAEELAKRGGDPELTVSAIGHAHIDLAWLWPIRETIRKGARTFSTALRNLEKYPDYVFGASQPQLYQWIKERYPKLYEQVKERVREGRWEAQGAMWVEPDANVPGGEALVRQVLYGKRFFRQEFGRDVRVLWLPDVFGYAGSLPQILKKSGVDFMMTQKLSWNAYNAHPHHSFWWEGIDGTRVLAHLPPEDTYNSPAAPRSLAKIERNYADKNVSKHALMLFGIGDGGGGPGEEHLERLARVKNLSGLPRVVQEPAERFFRRLEEEATRFQAFRGELYLEKHQGTLTTQGRSKRYNRLMEIGLRELEFAASLLWALGGGDYPAERLEEIWKEVLLYQFHDILPGSSITRVYEESLARYEVLLERVQGITRDVYGRVGALSGWYGEPVVFNSLPWDRETWVQWNGEWREVRVPAMGYRKLAEASLPPRQIEGLLAGERMLENERLRVRFGEDGSIVSVFDKTAGREALAPGGRANVFAVYHDDGDAWDFPRDYREKGAGTMRLEAIAAYVDGPKATVEQTYRFGDSVLTQRIALTSGSPLLEFATEADWRESGKMLRVSFPTAIRTEFANCEIQFGYLKRPTHRNTMTEFAKDEICAHRYIDLSQPDYGVALLNDCKYGHSALGGVLDLNLLRSPSYPDPTADRAVHRFTYALYPHAGDFVEAAVYRHGYELNVPLAIVEAQGRADGDGNVKEPISLVRVDHPYVMVEAVKKAEDSDHLIVRLYETAGTEADAAVSVGLPCESIEETDLMENPIAVLGTNASRAALRFAPFEIKTVRVRFPG
ncbi:alpha-mannosidase [Cohnella caldifontis]|uniref:alpha-mannosidase n=1 Tax=Cohnella caldifontis TaxID=3027471 RepID=UPI0023EC5BC7|nr:glycoside hydrolase family 38 C-terminal domain-containing protein [Cohnella sp. YIM B05605]